MVVLEKSPCVRSRIAATCSSWYGLERLSECPITSRVRMPKRSCSQRVSASEERTIARRPMTSASDTPTCSMPIAVWLRPTVWRQRHFSGTSWWIVPSRSIRKCAHTPGRSPYSTSGALAANVFHAALYDVPAV